MQFVRTSIPLPVTKRKAPVNVNRKSKYKFATMAIGDSDLTTEFVDAEKARATLSNAISAYKKRNPTDKRRYAVRVIFDEELQRDVLGVWCLAPKEAKVATVPGDATPVVESTDEAEIAAASEDNQE